MGIIRIDEIIKDIDDLTEEEIKEKYLLCDKINPKDWGFEEFLNYFRKHSIYIEYICYVDYEKAKILLSKFINVFQIKNIDIDEKVKHIREYGTRELVRVTDWEFSTIPLISDDEEKSLTCCQAEYKSANKWGEGTYPSKEKIIHDKNRNVIWIKNDYRNLFYFIKFNNNFYAIKNDHKMLYIYKNINIITKKLTVYQNYDNLDDIYKENDYEEKKCEEIGIDLSDYFPVGFFYRGPKYTKEWKELYPKGFNIYREITFQNRLLRIEIENLSYPHKGYVLLDLESEKVIEAKKYGEGK